MSERRKVVLGVFTIIYAVVLAWAGLAAIILAAVRGGDYWYGPVAALAGLFIWALSEDDDD